MRELRKPVPMPQSSSSPSWDTIGFDAMWNNLLPGKYAVLIPEFRNDKRHRDVRVYQQYIPLVIEFLEAWDNVPKNVQPKWYQACLASYSITGRLKWIFEQDKPQDWIQPMPEAGMQPGANAVPNYVPSVQPTTPQQYEQSPQQSVSQSPQPTGDAVPTASVPPAWQTYIVTSSQPSADAAASSWQRPAQSSWQLNSGTQNWSNQPQGSTWQGYSYQGSTTQQQDAWSNTRQSNPSDALINDGNFAKVNFTAGKLRRMLPIACNHGNCPDPEFEVKFSDEAMTHMFSFNSGDLLVWVHEVMYNTWLPPSLSLEKLSGKRNPMECRFINHEMREHPEVKCSWNVR
eukprot:4859786-Amphidinium_carterae.1